MALTREQFRQKMNTLLSFATPDNQANASELLTELSDEFDDVMTQSETATNRVQELTENNERLRKVNTDLFLKVGTPAKDTDTPPDTGTDTKTDPVSFESLFNEKGDLM